MALTSFCGLLTLQVGTAILSALFFCVAAVSLVANVFDYHNDIEGGWFPFSLFFLIIFATVMIAVAAILFVSSYSETRSMAIVAFILTIVLIAYWLILCCLSFLSIRDQVEGICIDIRCPESFWIANLRYRRYQIPPEQLEEDRHWPWQGGSAAPDTATDSGDRMKRDNTIKVDGLDFVSSTHSTDYVFVKESNTSFRRDRRYKRTPEPFEFLRPDSETSPPPSRYRYGNGSYYPGYDPDPPRYYFGLPLIGAIILFIVNLIFLLYSALVMYSWAQELDYTDYYYEEDPVLMVNGDYY